MNVSGTSRYALNTCVAAAILAGCGGSQPIGAPGAMPQSSQIAAHATRGGSWMLPEAKSSDLLYATGGCGGTCVVSYPDLKLVGSIPTSGYANCSDTQGNVFLSQYSSVVEYAHAGTQPIATLPVPGIFADGCAVDPETNNLAVVFDGYGGDIAIFANEQGNPTLYKSGIEAPSYGGYDDSGNLFVGGFDYGFKSSLVELPEGASQFINLSIPTNLDSPSHVQWDGKYVAYQTQAPVYIYRFAISGSNATLVGTVKFSLKHRALQGWLYDGKAFLPTNIRGSRENVIAIYKYPKGGKLIGSMRKWGDYKKRGIDFQAVTLSVAPSKSRAR